MRPAFLSVDFESEGKGEQLFKLFTREVRDADQVTFAPDAIRRLRVLHCLSKTFSKIVNPSSISALVTINGGMSRKTFPTVQLINSPSCRQASVMAAPSRSSSAPIIRPRPRTVWMNGNFSFNSSNRLTKY